MTHEMVIELGQPRGDGLTARLVCTEAEGELSGCREVADDPASCNVVQAFYWDSAAAMEDYLGAPLELKRAPIVIHGLDETEFSWDFAPESTVTEEER